MVRKLNHTLSFSQKPVNKSTKLRGKRIDEQLSLIARAHITGAVLAGLNIREDHPPTPQQNEGGDKTD
ncbi:hypothetical protein C0081_02345 [Cohaesibacter celericrescens]|uniref:Uncharacterized protein n=1 Tax=Cohaesibacter celericrescens TaxID=2067669 RepID=A0A2N5XX67_9HYPH|nr:hypothetical protein C0081_02345 [Cohaesibacter celericrescens]